MVCKAGCSSGEELYSLAMTLIEFADKSPGIDYRDLATGSSARVLGKAQQAICVCDEENVSQDLSSEKEISPVEQGQKWQIGGIKPNCSEKPISAA
jgi:chemotaxis methyl-accepting protein methylase